MQLKLGIVCIIAALPAAMFIPIAYGGYIAVMCCLLAGFCFVVFAPPLPGWPEDEEGSDDDPTVPAPGARSSRRIRRAQPESPDPAISGSTRTQEDHAASDSIPPAP